METLILYIVKVNLSLAVFYLLYVLLFRKDTFIKLRRYYFLSAIIFSLSYPLFTVSALGSLIDFSVPPSQQETSVFIGELSMESMLVEDSVQTTPSITLIEAMGAIMLTGILFFIFRILWQLLSIIRIKWRSEKKQRYGYTVYHLQDEITPFSFFNWIFVHLETHTEEELKQILLHEQTHVSQCHSLDVILAEMLCIAFWYNPIVWFMKRDIAINLEYLADNAVLQKGVDTHKYQCNLLQMNYPETAVQLINNFNVSQLKQRIIMMNSKKSPLRKLAKYLIVLPLALLLITANSVYVLQNEPEKEIKPPQEQDPLMNESKSNDEVATPNYQYIKKMLTFIESEMKYPKIAKENGIQGRVLASFTIEKDGSVTNPKIKEGVDPSLDKEAIRIINAMPKWIPFMQDGEPARSEYTLPFIFDLEGKDKSGDYSVIGFKTLDNEGKKEVIVRDYDSMNKASRETLLRKLANDDPLYIVDDVKMTKGFRLNSIIPTNIASISVLKDKAALEKYGEKGKNGVILITLKDRSKNSENNKSSEVMALGSGSMNDLSHQAFADKFGEGNPLIIVDDVKMKKGFDMNSIKPEDIESVSVLKDASAKASYGKEGKDGVIVIVTKPSNKGRLHVNNVVDGYANKEADDVFMVVEVQPEFPGGMEALMKYLGDNIKYPAEAHKNGIEGRVIANFIVNKDGSISDVNVVQGVDPLLDAEAVRVLSLMPLWKPGKQRGETVKVRFTIPVVFRLKKDETVDDKTMKKLKEKGPVSVVDVKDDASDKAFYEFIGKTIKYPVIAQENGIMGVVRAVYDVNEKGEVSNVRITKSVDPSLSAELVRLTKLIPNDIALMRSGGKAASNVEISALFRLQNGNTPPSERVESDVVVVGYGKPVRD